MFALSALRQKFCFLVAVRLADGFLQTLLP
jgi:hypothetical protein